MKWAVLLVFVGGFAGLFGGPVGRWLDGSDDDAVPEAGRASPKEEN